MSAPYPSWVRVAAPLHAARRILLTSAVPSRLPRRPATPRCFRLVLVAAVLGCSGDQQHAIDASRRLAATAKAANPKLPAPPPVAAQSAAAATPVLHVDASESMRGFVNCLQRPTQFDRVLDRLTVDLGITSVTSFGAQRSQDRATMDVVPASRELHCPAFYKWHQNPDYQLFDSIAADRGGATHFYLTDGVQSDFVGHNQSPSVERLGRWLAQGHALALLAFRGHFEGRGWSETRQAWIDGVSTEKRPFYLFVLAPTEPALDATLGRLSQSLRDSALVQRFAPGAATCDVALTQVSAVTRDAKIPWVMLTQTATQKAAAAPLAVADYACRIRPEFPLATLRPRLLGLAYWKWKGTSFDSTEAPNGLSVSARPTTTSAAGASTPLVVSADVGSGTLFGFAHAVLGAEPGELRPAVLALSADADAERADQDRTYRIGWLVEQLARAQVERTVAPRSFSFTMSYH